MASNEALFRLANERMAGWDERHEGGDAELYFCECVSDDCREKIRLSFEEYEGVRTSSRTFVVLPGHERGDVETVVEEHPDWVVVKKPTSVAGLVEATDPRSH